MIQFFQTMMGRKFYERDVPHLIRAIEKLSDQVEEMNKRLEKLEKEGK
ncbi:hypothetical protein ACSU64_27900 [Bacillaceae bacterium C204]